MNGLKIQWGRNIIVESTNSLVAFPTIYTTKPALFISTHYNSNNYWQADQMGYYVDNTGFKTDYYSGIGIDFFAIGY